MGLSLGYSARSLLRTPGPALALLFTISLGIGSNASVRAFVRGLTAPSHPLAGNIVSVFSQGPHGEAGPLSYREYLSVQGRADAFDWIGAVRVSHRAITVAGQSATVPVGYITTSLSVPLGLPLDRGVVISHRLHEAGFRGDRIQIEGAEARVGGVAPDRLEGIYRDRAVDIWMPLPEDAMKGSGRNLWVLGRLARGASMGAVQHGELRVLPYTGMTPEIAAGLSRLASLLNLAGGAVFLIACVNVASFLLGRAFARSQETAVRVALGAGRGRLVREVLSDSVVISLAGGACGLVLAWWTARALPALLYDRDAGDLVFAPDLFGIVAVSAACAAITILCGLLPVVVIRHDRPIDVLSRESAGPSRPIRRLRLGLLVVQMAGCCVLVTSTAVLFGGLRTAAGTSAGPTILASAQADGSFGIRYFQQVENAAKSLAGISEIAWAGRLPGSQPAWQSFRIDPAQSPLRDVTLDIASFTADSARIFVMPPRAGRMFGLAEQGCRAAVANEAAAATLFGADTTGRTLQDPAGLPVEILGVVATRKPEHVPTIYYDATNVQRPPPGRVAGMRFRAPAGAQLAAAELDRHVVSSNYFDLMKMPVIAGRDFAARASSDECRIGIVNQQAAGLYFGGNAVGAAVIDEQGRRTAIVGVVRSAPRGAFQHRVEPEIYFPMSQDRLPYMTMIGRLRQANVPTPHDVYRTIEPVPGRGPAPIVVKTLETHLRQTSLAPLRIATMILGASAALALLLTALGLFGALSDAARQRQRELAIRVALGAPRWRVIWQVLAEGERLVCAGAVAGMLASVPLSRWLAGITAAGVSPDLWVWLSAPLALAAAAAIASFLPARQATLVNPLRIMRDAR